MKTSLNTAGSDTPVKGLRTGGVIPDSQWGAPLFHSAALVSAQVLFVDSQPSGMKLTLAIAGHPRPVEARLATSCLVQPEEGDWVLVHVSLQVADEQSAVAGWWVLSVLLRTQPEAPVTLTVPQATEIELRSPALQFSAQHHLGMMATDVHLTAHKANVQIKNVVVTTSVLHVIAQRMTRVVSIFKAMADSVVLQSRVRVAVIDELDSVRAGVVNTQAREVMQFKGEQVLLDAKETMRLDGKHILMG